MLALYRSGRQAEALAAYQRARRVLVDELGIEPGRSLRELEQAILEQDPRLDLAVGDEAAARTRSRGAPSSGARRSSTSCAPASRLPSRAEAGSSWSPASPAPARAGWPTS